MNNFLDKVTIVIKTFNRPYHLDRLIKSILTFYPNIKIIIANDGNDNIDYNIENIKVYNLPFNLGIAYGRNFLVEAVTSDYLITLDDDFIVTEKSNFLLLQNLICNSEYDIIGGTVFCVDKGERHFEGTIKFTENSIFVKRIICEFDNKIQKCDVIHNFFIAKRTAFLSVKWDNNLKNYEHLDFFIQAIGKLKIGYYPLVEITHNQNPKYEHYLKYRLHTNPYIDYFFSKYNVSILELFEKKYVANKQ